MAIIRPLLVTLLVAGCAVSVPPYQPTPQPQPLSDQDSDGVIDARDRCADTPLGAQVDNYGCSKVISDALSVDVAINFSNDSVQIPQADEAAVAALAAYLQREPGTRARLDGHASAVGPDDHNNQLSLHRAQAVRDLLVTKHGISPERIEIASYGSTRPLVVGDDEQAFSANRRVEGEAESRSHTADVMRWTIYTPGR